MTRNIPALAYFAYNRKSTVAQTLPNILKYKFNHIYIFADGAKNIEDQIKVTEVRKIILKLTKNKDVTLIFYKKNKGLRKVIFESLDFVFKKESMAIIMEDDTLADQIFFNFCKKLLNFHKNDKNIWCIGGSNFLKKKYLKNNVYFYTKYFHCWGWATWKDRWKKIDRNVVFWPEWKNSKNFSKIFKSIEEKNYWKHIFESVYKNELVTWDYQVFLNLLYKQYLTIIPPQNLVQNIGFGLESTSTNFSNIDLCKPINSISINKIKKNEKIELSEDIDRRIFDIVWEGARMKCKNSISLLLYFLTNYKKYYYKLLYKIKH